MPCNNCGKEINPQSAFCDQCGAPVNAAPQQPAQQNTTLCQAEQPRQEKKMNGCLLAFIIFMAVVLVGGIAVLIGGYFISKKVMAELPAITEEWQKIAAAAEIESAKNMILVGGDAGLAIKNEKYSSYLEGKLKNESQESYSYVSVSFSLYDAQGNKIGVALDNTSDIGPGETWAFEALIVNPEKVASYKLDRILAI